MNESNNIDTKVLVQLNSKLKIIGVKYDYLNQVKSQISIIISLTTEDFKKVNNQSINYEELFKEITDKYKEQIVGKIENV